MCRGAVSHRARFYKSCKIFWIFVVLQSWIEHQLRKKDGHGMLKIISCSWWCLCSIPNNPIILTCLTHFVCIGILFLYNYPCSYIVWLITVCDINLEQNKNIFQYETFNVPRFFFILLTHVGSHREVYRDFQPSWTSSAGGAKGWSDHRFCAPPAYTAQLLTLHQHRASNQ